MRQEGLTNEVQNLRQVLDDQEAYKKKFKDDVFDCLHHITDYKKLKAGVIRLHKIHVKDEGGKNEGADTDIHRDHALKRRWLEQNVNYLKRMMIKDQEVHKKENTKIMQENVYLLFEINDQIKEKHALKQKIKENYMRINELSNGAANYDDQAAMFDGDIDRELRMQDLQIEELARQVEEYQQSNEMLKQQKPQIGNLPPMDQQQQEMMQMQYQQQQEQMMQQQQPAMDDMQAMEMPPEMEGMGMGEDGQVQEQLLDQPPQAMEAPAEAAPEEVPADQPPAQEPAEETAPVEQPPADAAAEQPPTEMEGGDQPPQ